MTPQWRSSRAYSRDGALTLEAQESWFAAHGAIGALDEAQIRAC
ncbi:MAG: hypothetical protein QOI91_2661 [Solirubrobacteraceae bacterium]|jgi:hypothetical protein|nr:hypothetical protein [Solirubrobacteraceae bacterium]